ncbi:MAG: hypothetical protein DYG89_23120 [Caldilinea sp. CFX5]|nr:hypothetical protein [Caldilinea sp. CFX5]
MANNMANKRWFLFFCLVGLLMGSVVYTQQTLAASIEQSTIPLPSDTPTATPTDPNLPPQFTPTPTNTPTLISTGLPTATPLATPIPPQPTSTPASTGGADQSCTRNPWRFTTNMTTKRLYHAAVAVNGNLYALGGHEYPGVERALINADGTLDLWQRVNFMVMPRGELAAVAHGGYIYALGGVNGSAIAATEFAQVQPDGSLSAWQLTSAMNQPRSHFAAVAANGYLYAIGGDNQTPATVERARFNADGTLGAWEMINQMNYQRRSRNAAVINNFVYVVGDSTTSGQADSIERAALNADGSLGVWQVVGALSVNRFYSSMVATSEFIYLFGGYTSAVNYNTVLQLPVRPDGSIGPALFLDAMHFARQGPVAVAVNGNVYLLGGGDFRGANTEESVEWTSLAALAIPRDYGVSINQGALFTNQTDVTLAISGRTSAVEMQVSNDGGFAGAHWEPCRATKAWQITRFGSSILPRTVYVRYRDAQGAVSSVVQDDIILDVTAPSGSVEIAPLAPRQQRGVVQIVHPASLKQTDNVANRLYLPMIATSRSNCPQTGTPTVSLQLNAQDDVSGVKDMLISNTTTFTCADWQSYAATQAWYVPSGATTTVYVKFRDNAGNVSAVVQDTVTLPVK